MITIRIYETIVGFPYNVGTIWLDQIDSYGIDSMFKVNQSMSYCWFIVPRSMLSIRNDVHYCEFSP